MHITKLEQFALFGFALAKIQVPPDVILKSDFDAV